MHLAIHRQTDIRDQGRGSYGCLRVVWDPLIAKLGAVRVRRDQFVSGVIVAVLLASLQSTLLFHVRLWRSIFQELE